MAAAFIMEMYAEAPHAAPIHCVPPITMTDSLSETHQVHSPEAAQGPPAAVKPLLRGWIHAAAALGAVVVTIWLCWLSHNDMPRLLSMLVFGLSMVELYTISAIYHIGKWTAGPKRVLRAMDHSNIFVMIAGTYTPICVNALSGAGRVALLAMVWALAIAGVGLSVATIGVRGFRVRVPRWLSTGLYVAMGWVALLALPAFLSVLPWGAVALFVLGGVLYTIGAVVYAIKWPDPFPRVLGFHEVFHLFVVAGGIAFTVAIWVWVLPFPRA